MTRRFAVIEVHPGGPALLGARPLVTVEASGPAALGVATALEAVARRLRLDVQRATRRGRELENVVDLAARRRAGGR